jgi:hypothetical protein
MVQTMKTENAGDAFGRAAIAGRLAESKGALSVVTDESPTTLVGEAEKYATLSRKYDAEFRAGAATRMLGTIYILAPANMLEGGDSEEGLSMLEGLVKAHPEVPENQLRYAEGLIALGDKEPAKTPLCRAKIARAQLRKDEAALVDKLVQDIGELDCSKVSAPPAPASTTAPSAEPSAAPSNAPPSE